MDRFIKLSLQCNKRHCLIKGSRSLLCCSSGVYRISNMGKSPCRRSAKGFERGAWTAEEDMILSKYIGIHGDRAWRNIPQKAGLRRCGKSCRLRWLNYLRPDINHRNITPDEEDLIIRMHRLLGNRWSLIAGRLPGRTDNKIKNYWNTYLCKKLTVNESQSKTQMMKRESITSPSPVQNHMFKPKPVKMVRPNSCNGSGSNHSSDEAAFKLYNVKETTNSSKSVWCDLLEENSKTDNESEHVASAMADVILVGTEVTNSAHLMSYLADEQSSHSESFSATLAQSLVLLNELSSPNYNLLSYSSDCSLTDFGLGELYKRPVTFAAEKSEFEVISNMQPVNGFTFAEV